MSREKRLSKQDEMMRRDGLVTAVEVSEATGLALSAVHRGIDEGRVPGKTVKVSDRYSHRYVDIAAYVALAQYEGAPTIQGNLKKLQDAVVAARVAARLTDAKSKTRSARAG